MNQIHEACEAGARDGSNFDLSDYEFVMRIFSRQFEDEAREAYESNFLAAVGNRLNPACA